MAEDREIIFELQRIGGAVKLVAVDVATGIEASVMGPAGSGKRKSRQRGVGRHRLSRHKTRNGLVVERQQRIAVRDGHRLRRQLSARHHADRPPRRANQHKPRQRNRGVL